jgi:Holliday junction DNA helicase RuvA
MIAHLRGKLLSKHPNQAIVETAGVGYDVVITVPTFSDLPALGNEVALHIHTHVREDTIALYGFFRPAESNCLKSFYRERDWAKARDHNPERHGSG